MSTFPRKLLTLALPFSSLAVMALLLAAANPRFVQASIQTAPPQSFGEQPATGKFLVASESIRDPRFRHAVILLLTHGDGGTLGLIVNRPTGIPLSDAISADAPLGQLHFGGPVRPTTAVSLLVAPGAGDEQAPDEERSVVIEGIYYVFGRRETLDELSRLQPEASFRVYAGYAGWAPGQLESEIRGGGWYLTAADADAVFSEDTGGLWDSLIRRLRGRWI